MYGSFLASLMVANPGIGDMALCKLLLKEKSVSVNRDTMGAWYASHQGQGKREIDCMTLHKEFAHDLRSMLAANARIQYRAMLTKLHEMYDDIYVTQRSMRNWLALEKENPGADHFNFSGLQEYTDFLIAQLRAHPGISDQKLAALLQKQGAQWNVQPLSQNSAVHYSQHSYVSSRA